MKELTLYRSDFVERDGESAFDDLLVSLGLEKGYTEVHLKYQEARV